MPLRTARSFSPAAPLIACLAALLALGLGGCAAEPPAPPLDPALPAAWKEAAPVAGWAPAQPLGVDASAWWQRFEDPVLDGLAARVLAGNQTLAAAVAAVAQAEAALREQRAGLFPVVAAGANARRSGGGDAGDVAGGRSAGVSLGASWTPDLWGRLRGAVDAAGASAQATQADLAAARLAATGTLVATYFSLRGADAEAATLEDTVQGYGRSLQITRNRYDAGIVARTDVLQAESQLAAARADLAATRQERARLEHALAALVGVAPADFALPPVAAGDAWAPRLPPVPLVLPSELLQRRPDIAAAGRDVAAANAQIGVQRSAYYPSIGLSASLERNASRVADLFSASNTLWSLGLSLTQAVFDAGATAARVDGARAVRDGAVARYRQTVLGAFQGVEDALSDGAWLAQQATLRAEQADAAARVEQQVLNRYRAGQVGFTEVVAAQAQSLAARRAVVRIAVARGSNVAALAQATGGGWAGL